MNAKDIYMAGNPDHAKIAALTAERDQLQAQLSVTTQATKCARCGVVKHTPTRDNDGYI